MSYEEPLSKLVVSLSISDSPDLAMLGLATEHLEDAMSQIVRHLLAMGTRLVYGGDLRPGGFTEVLFELVARYRRDADIGDERVGVSNVLPWPVHISLSPEGLKELSEGLSGVAELVYLTVNGKAISPAERQRLVARPATAEEWVTGLTAMREVVTRMSNARIVLGGRIEGYEGRMPGIAEEALASLRRDQPLFVLGGFGGCSRYITEALGLATMPVGKRSSWPGRDDFKGFTAGNLNNGLDGEENTTLATSVYVDQLATLILRGLLRKTNGPSAVTRNV